jgi:hypothetical protein
MPFSAEDVLTKGTRGGRRHTTKTRNGKTCVSLWWVSASPFLSLFLTSHSLSLSLSLSDHLLNSAAPMRYTEIPIQYPPDEVKVPESSPALSEQEILKPTIL